MTALASPRMVAPFPEFEELMMLQEYVRNAVVCLFLAC
jgi:hypothetical protein